jgi:hypothetical protein
MAVYHVTYKAEVFRGVEVEITLREGGHWEGNEGYFEDESEIVSAKADAFGHKIDLLAKMRGPKADPYAFLDANGVDVDAVVKPGNRVERTLAPQESVGEDY